MIVNNFLEIRIRPLSKKIKSMLKHPHGDPFVYLCDGMRFALVPLFDASLGKKTKYGDDFPTAMKKLFDDTILVTVDAAQLLFKNGIQGIDQYIKDLTKSISKYICVNYALSCDPS